MFPSSLAANTTNRIGIQPSLLGEQFDNGPEHLMRALPEDQSIELFLPRERLTFMYRHSSRATNTSGTDSECDEDRRVDVGRDLQVLHKGS